MRIGSAQGSMERENMLPKTKFPEATAAIAAGLSVSSASDRGTKKK